MSDDTPKNSFTSFWTTLPGILTGLAALITAIGGLVTAIYVARGPEDTSRTQATGSPPTATLPAPGRPAAGAPPAVATGAPAASGQSLPIPGVSRAAALPGLKQVHQMNIPPPSLLEGDVTAAQTCLRMSLSDASGNPVYHNGEDCFTYEYFAILTGGSTGGVYVLTVENCSPAQGEYSVDLRLRGQDDANTGADAGSAPANAILLANNGVYQGLVGSQDPEDYYIFTADSSMVLTCRYDQWDEVAVTLQRQDAGPQASEETIPRDGQVDFSQRPAGRYLLKFSNRLHGSQYTIILGSR
ncbi:MAG: hypothetical protein FJ316_01465 [SAR202 cluster bacterium]|nr:hypothetical protein [SAR202 cluster bacterium]